MKRPLIVLWPAIVLGLAIAIAANLSNAYTPGSRVEILSHNAYPDRGKFTDRLDRTLAIGLPVAIEEDLAWVDGRSLLIHGAKNESGDDPTLDTYFFPKVKSIHGKGLEGRQ